MNPIQSNLPRCNSGPNARIRSVSWFRGYRFAVLSCALSLPALLVASAAEPAAPSPEAASPSPAAATKPAATPRVRVMPPDIELIRAVETGSGGGRPLHVDIYRLKKPSATPMPAVLMIHGGGWRRGEYNQGPGPLVEVARAGYFGASVEYRLSGEAKWPAQIEDCKLAVRWLRANAKKYNVDPDRIGVWGPSAGGHLVVCLAAMDNQPQFEGNGGYPGVSSKVNAVVDIAGPTDFTQGSAGFAGVKGGEDAPIISELIGHSQAERPDLWKEASPLGYVHPGMPPFMIIHGDQDKTVPPSQSDKLVAALRAAKVPVEFIPVHGGGHNLQAPAGAPPAEPDKRTYLKSCFAFLDHYLKNSPATGATPAAGDAKQ